MQNTKPLKSFESIWLALTSVYPDCQVSSRSKEHYLCKSKQDGYNFNCVTLPKLGKTVYASFETGKLASISEFHYENGVPEFLRELFSRVYTNEGLLREDLSSVQIRVVRLVLQLTMVFYKYEDASLVDNEAELVTKFRELQDSRRHFLSGTLSSLQVNLLSKAKSLIHTVLSNEDPCDIIPFHGSGAVAEKKLKNWHKWANHPYYPDLEKLYPQEEYNRSSFCHICDSWVNDSFNWPVKRVPSVRIITVPKNSTTRRMIAVEETYPQYIKMGLMTKMYNAIERHRLTKGKVNFTRQEINQELARIGSKDRSLATLDLSSASDSVYVGIVEALFPRAWSDALTCTRAKKAIWEGNDYQPGCSFDLYTFATMGSATCFPVEALVFWAIVSACVGHTRNFVYGDDIVVNNSDYSHVVEALTSLGFTVNMGKSYTNGFFRESCGADYLHGSDVTVVKLRHEPSGFDSSTVQFLNNITKLYGEQAMLRVYTAICMYTGCFIPFTTDRNLSNEAVFTMSERAANFSFLKGRYNRHLQRYEFLLSSSVPVAVKVKDSWFEVMRSLAGKSSKTSHCTYDDASHTRLVWRWICLYPGYTRPKKFGRRTDSAF